MKTVEKQTIYQCEYCDKRFLTKQGVKRHEENYCYLSPIPKMKREEKVNNCKHEWETEYSYIPGEAVMEPDHVECIWCGVHQDEWERKSCTTSSNQATSNR